MIVCSQISNPLIKIKNELLIHFFPVCIPKSELYLDHYSVCIHIITLISSFIQYFFCHCFHSHKHEVYRKENKRDWKLLFHLILISETIRPHWSKSKHYYDILFSDLRGMKIFSLKRIYISGKSGKTVT